MKVLMLSTDANIAKEGESASERIKIYGSLVEKMTVFILAGRGAKTESSLGDNIRIKVLGSAKSIWPLGRAVFLGLKTEADIITCQDPFFTGLVGCCLKWWLKSPLEIQVHTDLFSPAFGAMSRLNMIKVRLAKYTLPQADRVRVVSDRIKHSLLEAKINLQAQVEVLPIFVDTEKIKKTVPSFDLHQRYPSFKNIILMVSRLAEEKDFPLALNAFAILVREYPASGLVIVGAGPERKNILALAGQLGISDRVVLEGWKTDLISYYKTADVFLQTSLFEGYGLALVEAVTAGLPVVSTPVGIMEENLGVVAISANELAAGLRKSLSVKKNISRLDHIIKFKNFTLYAEAIVAGWSNLMQK